MPLIHDPEYKEELERALKPILAQNRRHWRLATFGLGAVLALVIWALRKYEVSAETLLLAVISVSAVWAVGVLQAGANALFSSIVTNICAVEWCGRKQLGEYEKP
jgi:hypothetical protein